MTSNTQLEKALQQKYGEEFMVRDDSYQFELGVNVFKASPKRYPALIFEGRQKDGVILLDYYPEVLWNFEAENKVRELLKKENLSFWVKCFVTGENRFENGKLIHFNNLLHSTDATARIENVIYLFEDINTFNKEKLLKEIAGLASFYNQFEDKKIYISVEFWDQSFTKGKKIEDMYFTVNVDAWKGKDYPKEFGYENDDNTSSKRKYVKHDLSLKFISSVNFDFTTDTLFSLVKPYDITDIRSYFIDKSGNIKLSFENL